MTYIPVSKGMSTPDVVSGTAMVTIKNNVSEHVQTVTLQTSFRNDCIEVVFSKMQYLPWDNPDNIVSVEVETIVRKVKYNLLLLLFLIGGPANVINMAVFYKQGLKDRVTLCLFALALADELALVGPMIYHGEQLIIQFTTGEMFGPIATALTNSNMTFIVGFCYVSPVFSAIIATERCICVFNPLKFQLLLRTKTMAIIIVVVYVLILGLFFIICFRYRVGCVYDPTTGMTVVTGVEGEFYKVHKEFINHLDGFVLGVGLPGIEMIVVITTTVMTIYKLRQIVTWRSETSTTISAPEVALTKMLVGNSILFIVCSFPVALIRFSWLFFPEMNSGRRHQNFFLSSLWISEVFSFMNTTFNIFVYYAMGSRYRKTYWELFGRNPMKSVKETAT